MKPLTFSLIGLVGIAAAALVQQHLAGTGLVSVDCSSPARREVYNTPSGDVPTGSYALAPDGGYTIGVSGTSTDHSEHRDASFDVSKLTQVAVSEQYIALKCSGTAKEQQLTPTQYDAMRTSGTVNLQVNPTSL